MNVPSPPALRPEDFPDIEPKLLEVLFRAFQQNAQVLEAVPERGLVTGVAFTSAASGASLVDVRNPLGVKPEHVTVTLRRDDMSPLAAVWSFEFSMVGEKIRLSILGLPASVKMRLSLEAR